MRDKLFIVIAGIVLLLAGCSKPEYLIEGLTLPPGSKVVTKTNTTGSPGDMGMGMPMGAVDNGVTVVFNCGSD